MEDHIQSKKSKNVIKLTQNSNIDLATKFTNTFLDENSKTCSKSNSSCKEPLVGNSSNGDKTTSTVFTLKNNTTEKETFINNSTSNSSLIKCVPAVEKPKVGDVWNVYVSKMESKKCFFVQNKNYFEYIEYIQTICSALEFDGTHSISSLSLPKVGNLVAARDKNGLWNRAKIKRKNEMGLSVCFIDFCNDEVLVTDIINLPTEFIDIKPMAYRCFFKNLSKQYEEIFDSEFFYLISKYFCNIEMTAVFLNNKEPYSVKLLQNGNDILDLVSLLATDGIVPGLSDDPIDLAKHKMLKTLSGHQAAVIHIGPIISTEHFYVETEYSNKISKNIRIEIENMTSWISVSNPEEGKIVIAKSKQDTKLYRARVLLCYEGQDVYKCFLIDCGTFENCSEFFEPSEYLLTAPPAKIYCSLYASKKVNEDLQESMTLALIDEMTQCIDDPKIMEVIKIGSPCKVDIVIKGLKISDVIKPRVVRVISILNVNAFKAQLNTKGSHKIMDVLKCTKKFSTVSDPELHKLYVARHEEQYKRAKYMGRDELRFEVVLVDEIPRRLIINEMYELPKSIKNTKTVNIHCSLGVESHHYSMKKFIDIAKNGKTKFIMVITKNDYVNGHNVKLFFDSKDVTELICNEPVK